MDTATAHRHGSQPMSTEVISRVRHRVETGLVLVQRRFENKLDTCPLNELTLNLYPAPLPGLFTLTHNFRSSI